MRLENKTEVEEKARSCREFPDKPGAWALKHEEVFCSKRV